MTIKEAKVKETYQEKALAVDGRYYKLIEKELNMFCDSYFVNDSDIEKYCKQSNIPFEIGDYEIEI
jgi:hypothetical protein